MLLVPLCLDPIDCQLFPRSSLLCLEAAQTNRLPALEPAYPGSYTCLLAS